ncbi:MAG: FAD/NAD(P)-binding protein [Burkholderiaceae bacterium]|nr:FAD/NAD(P)-binding protein [Burkholderiaceae bacterium]
MKKTILIVGGGFSGAVTAARLLQQTQAAPLRIILVNGSGRVARGMAYGTQSPDHTLNVPAGNMSAFDDTPDHFLRYAQARDPDVHAGSFVSRGVYGDYLEWLLTEAERQASPGTTLERLYQHVTSIVPIGSSAMVTLECGETMQVDKVVLALGHFASNHPRIADAAFYNSQRYIRDPWDTSELECIEPDEPVLLLGTGLTAVDIAMTLLNRNPQRQITAVSRRGLLPQHHRHGAHPPAAGLSPEAIWGTASTVREQLREFRRYCNRLAAQGKDWREAMALLRPVTAGIWLAYTEKERKRFLRHVQPYWDTHRHRLAPAVFERFDAALKAGVIQTLAARVRSFDESGNGINVTLQPRGSNQTTHMKTAWVINCTGPCANPHNTGNALVDQLLRDGLIRTDKLGLGLEMGDDCAAIDMQGRTSDTIFYIGPWLKAHYWEATAVPDLRRFAKALATRLLAAL